MHKILWRRKPITTPTQNDQGLKRVLGPWRLIALGVGIIVGAGLFSLTGVAAGQYAGPAVMLSFFFSAIACSFAGLCYTELAGMLPVGGSAYSYAYASLGEFVAWIIGWDLILEYTVGASAVASSWSGYLGSLLKSWHMPIDPRFLAAPFSNVILANGTHAHAWFNVPAFLIVIIVTIFLMRGTEGSSLFNTAVVVVKLSIVAIVIILALPFIKAENYHPFIPANTGQYGHFGWTGIIHATGIIFFSYIGFDVVSTTAQDSDNPQKNIPIGILGSLLVSALIYIIFSAAMVGVVNYHLMANDPEPVATVIDNLHQPWIAVFVKLGVCFGFLAAVYGMLLGQSRVTLSVAQDGLIPSIFGKIDPKTKTPHLAHILAGLSGALLAGSLPISILGEMTSIGTLFAFVVVCLAVLVLRIKSPDSERRFRVPGGTYLVPLLGMGTCGIVMLGMGGFTWLTLFIWLSIGIMIYGFYGHRKSKLHQTDSHSSNK